MECCDSGGKARALYVGESSRSMSERYGEHIDAGEKLSKELHMVKHWSLHQRGERTKFKVEVIGFFNSALERQVAESIRIEKTGA